MAEPALLQADFTRMFRDAARNQLPQGSIWNAIDWLPATDAPLRNRGGWANVGAVSSVTASATAVIQGIYAPFTAGAQNLAVDNLGNLYKFTGVAAVSAISATTAVGTTPGAPVFHANTVIFPSPNGTQIPRGYNGTSLSALAATAPAGLYACVFKDYTVLANTSANPRRQFFSTAGSPTGTWDTTNSIIDYSRPIRGMAALRNAILVFHDDTTSRLRGSIPPDSTDSGDFTKDDPAFQVGLMDSRSIATYQEQAYWVSTKGVFRSDGISLDNLTRRGGMLQYWQDLMQTFAPNWIVSGGIFNDTYVIVIMNETTFVDAFMIDLAGSFGWTRISNTDFVCFWGSVATVDQLYAGRKNAGMVAGLASMWAPASGTKNDGDGDAVLPVLETAFYEGRPGPKRIKSVYLGYQLEDYGSDDPTMTVSYATTPEATSYTALSPTLAEATTYVRTRIPIGLHSEGLALKLSRTSAGSTKLYALEAEISAEEPGRRI